MPSKPDYGHCNVGNANSRESVKNSNFSSEVQICRFTLHTFEKKKFSIWSCETIKIPMNKMWKILQILKNTVNPYKYNTCTMQYFLCLEVCYLVLFFWIVFSFSSSISVCNPILTNVPTPLNFQRIKFCLRPCMDKSLSLIKFTIIMCESILEMKDCNGEVLT